MTMERIDVVLPIYQPTDHVYEAIESVRSQSYEKWHLFIVDDASGDDSLASIKNRYGDLNGKVTYFQSAQNRCAAACRNFAVGAGDGEYIAFIDQDDVWIQDKLQLQHDYACETDVDVVHGNVQFIDVHGRIIRKKRWEDDNESRRAVDWRRSSRVDLSHKIIKYPNIRIISSMVRRHAFEKIGGFKDWFFGGEDELFWFEMARNSNFGYLDHVLFYRRIHSENTCNKFKIERLRGYIRSLNYIGEKYPDMSRSVIKAKLRQKALELTIESIRSMNGKDLIYGIKVFMARDIPFV